MEAESPPLWSLTCAAQARKRPVVNARMIRCTAGLRRFMMSGIVASPAVELASRERRKDV